MAELEATTARKGNRKVSLKISGWVNEAVFWWEDGQEKNVYVGTNKLEETRFRFSGDAKIVDGWSACFLIELGLADNASNTFSQDSQGATNSTTIRKANWWIKSKDYGQVSVGLNGTATYHLLDDADGANTRFYSDAEAASVAMGAFLIRSNGAFVANPAGGNLKWTDLLRGFNNSTPGQDGRRSVVRYDSPTWEGFAVIAAM